MKRPAACHSNALVLHSRVYGESDKILTFLTRDFGKIAGIAKGALRSKKRFVNSLEPFATIRLGFRLSARSDLAWVETAEILRPCRNAIRDLDRYAWSTYVTELADCMVEGQEAEKSIFDLVEATLARIDSTFPAPLERSWLRSFEARLLMTCGLSPRLDDCCSCGKSIESSGDFQPGAGTVRCPDCSDGSGMEISAEAVGSIRRLHNGEEHLSEQVANEVRMILQAAIAHHLRRPLRSPALLREIVAT
jgi:DNA repair protein RecO (recombination protein O)